MEITGNTFKLINIAKNNNRIDYEYKVEGDWKRYFNLSNKMYIEYNCNIDTVPYSVMVIPLICNIIPIAWLCDAKIFLDEIDEDFYLNLEKIKKGYENMYPMLAFMGSLIPLRQKNNLQNNKKDIGATFFSGGVDAYTTMFRHLHEIKYLMTLWGSDVALQDIEGWEIIKRQCQNVSKRFDIDLITIKSNFREIIDEMKLDLLVHKSNDGWWHGFQHGIGIISHAAPVAYVLGIKKTFIASSYSEKMSGYYTCASDPTIDSHVKYCGCRTLHDGYELNRQDKIRYLIQKKAEGYPIALHVCWSTGGGYNCCMCEKCYRTILEIVSEGADPNDFGFVWSDIEIARCEKQLKYLLSMTELPKITTYYEQIQIMLKQNYTSIKNNQLYEWLLNYDFSSLGQDIELYQHREKYFKNKLIDIQKAYYDLEYNYHMLEFWHEDCKDWNDDLRKQLDERINELAQYKDWVQNLQSQINELNQEIQKYESHTKE